jgi:hypothetical protein
MTTKHDYHECFGITLETDLAKDAARAFNGAKYHLDRAKQMASKGKEGYAQFRHDQFDWEIRAFFWELTASYESILQWANREFDLKLQETRVDQKTVLEALAHREPARWHKTKMYLEEAGNSAWYFEIKAYRNFNIHRAFTPLPFVVRMPEPFDANGTIDKGQIVHHQLYPAREGQECTELFSTLARYINEMASLGNRIFTLKPSASTAASIEVSRS